MKDAQSKEVGRYSYDIHVIFMRYSYGALTPPHPGELVEHPVKAPVAPERRDGKRSRVGNVWRILEMSGDGRLIPQFSVLKTSEDQAAA